MAKIDFARVALLFTVVDAARDYGTAYSNIRREAEEELKKINNADAERDGPVIQTPAAGPPSSERVHPDGTVEQIGDGVPDGNRPANERDGPYTDQRRSYNDPRNVERPRDPPPVGAPTQNPPRPASHPDPLPRPESLR